MEDKLCELISDKNLSIEDFIYESHNVLCVSHDVSIFFEKKFPGLAAYSPFPNLIKLNLNNIRQYLVMEGLAASQFDELYLNEKNKVINNISKKIGIIHILAHENDHVLKRLISKGIIYADSELQEKIYKDLFLSFGRNPILNARYLKYISSSVFFERDAEITANLLCINLARKFDNRDLEKYFMKKLNFVLQQGYIGRASDGTPTINTEGSVKMSYKYAFKEKKYYELDIPQNLPLGTKIKYGLELTEEELNGLFSFVKNNDPYNDIQRKKL